MAKKPAKPGVAKPAGKRGASRAPAGKREPKALDEGGGPAGRGPIAIPTPRPLGDVVGQERAVHTLRAAIRSGKVHHAWIFQGPAGVGKFTTALAFAAALLDPTTRTSPTGDPDPDGPVQRLLRAGTHPDLHVVVKELARFHPDPSVRDRKLVTIPKEVVEEHLIRPAQLASQLRHDSIASKVFIVDEAELLDRSPTNAPTQNSLLKTLEEPPERTVIILVTSSEEKLLATIRSRCQRVAFFPLADGAFAQYLKGHPAEAPAEEVGWLRAFAEGSPGVFQSALSGGIYGWWKSLSPGLEKARRGEVDPGLGAAMGKLVEEWAARHVEASPNASKEAANRAGTEWLLRVIARDCRQHLRSGRDPGAMEREASAIDTLTRASRHADANLNFSILFDHLAMDLAGAGR